MPASTGTVSVTLKIEFCAHPSVAPVSARWIATVGEKFQNPSVRLLSMLTSRLPAVAGAMRYQTLLDWDGPMEPRGFLDAPAVVPPNGGFCAGGRGGARRFVLPPAFLLSMRTAALALPLRW